MKAPEFWRTGQGGLLASVLSPLAWAYGRAASWRQSKVTPWRPSVPVICIGNAVVGGAGKTPVVLDLTARLIAKGKRVSLLSRGYGGAKKGPHHVNGQTDKADQVGDEPLLLCRRAPTWVSRDRVAGAKAASQGADVIVMDDGFQNPSLVKAASLLIIDGQYGFGNGHLIPAGPLREHPDSALSRASAVVFIGAEERGLVDRVSTAFPDLPLLHARVMPGPEIKQMAGKRITAFAGIAQPEKFYRTLLDAGCDVVSTRSFPDHHPYTAAALNSVKAMAKEMQSLLVTTEKDLVRIADDQRDGIEALTITLEWDDEAALNSLLDRLL